MSSCVTEAGRTLVLLAVALMLSTVTRLQLRQRRTTNSSSWLATAMNLLLSTLAMLFGLLVVVSPTRAAKIWAAGRLDGLAPRRRVSFLRWYRVFGVVLFLGGLLSAVDSIGFSSYSR
jgi:nitric oxide reductase large subunit